MADKLIDEKSKLYFESLGRYAAYVIMSVVVLTMVSLSSALIGKWTGVVPTLPTFMPPPVPVGKQAEPVPEPKPAPAPADEAF
jgi:hypothetical protein